MRGTYTGEIRLNGKRVAISSPHDSQRVGIAVVRQRSMLVPELSVAQNMMLGREPRRFGLVDEARLESEARQLLERFGLADVLDPAMPVSSLGPGLQQIVEILRGLAHRATLLVLDEPTASLLPRERERLLTWLRTLVVQRPSEYNPLVSKELDALTLRGLSRESSRRFESARAFALELERLVRPAMPAEISEWVLTNARTSLALRSEKLARMERQASVTDDASPPRSAPS